MPAADRSPPQPLKLQTRVTRADGQLCITYRTRISGGAVFMAIWLILWTVACVAVGCKFFTKPAWTSILLVIPFWSFWLFVVAKLLQFTCQREKVIVDQRGLLYTRRVIIQLSQRIIPLPELKGCSWFSFTGESGIEVQNRGKRLRCLFNLADDELEWLEFQLTQHAQELQRCLGVDHRPDRIEGGEQPPVDCRWTLADDFDDLTFYRRGRLELSALPTLLFLNLFWNSILTVFILVLLGVMPGKNLPPMFGGQWWMLFFFLIPFEVLGIAMLVALVRSLAEPMHQTHWTIRPHQIELRHRCFGLGRTQCWQIESLDRIKMARQPGPTGSSRFNWRFHSVEQLNQSANLFCLRLIAPANREVCTIHDLTEAEARWIRQIIKRRRPEWF